jgi:hypothetical protein
MSFPTAMGAFSQECSCGRVFAQPGAFKNHQNVCLTIKHELSTALRRAQDILVAKKARKVAALKPCASESNCGTESSVPDLEDTMVSHSDVSHEVQNLADKVHLQRQALTSQKHLKQPCPLQFRKRDPTSAAEFSRLAWKAFSYTTKGCGMSFLSPSSQFSLRPQFRHQHMSQLRFQGTVILGEVQQRNFHQAHTMEKSETHHRMHLEYYGVFTWCCILLVILKPMLTCLYSPIS